MKYHFMYLIQCFSTRSDFIPWGYLAMSGDLIGCFWHLVCWGQDAARHSTKHWTVPHDRIIQIKMSVVLRLRNHDVL